MSVIAEIVITGKEMAHDRIAPKVAITVEGASQKVVSIEVEEEMPKSPRSPRAWPTLTKEGPKTEKDKKKAPKWVCASPKKHPQKENPIVQEKGKVIDLKPEEDVEEIHMDEEYSDMGWMMLLLRGLTLSLNWLSTFLYVEERQRFRRALMKARSCCIHPFC